MSSEATASQGRAYSVIVAEDEPLIRRSLVKKLEESCAGFEVVYEAADGQEALNAMADLAPDILVTDIRMPAIDGIALIRGVYFSYPDVKIIIVSGYDDFNYARSALTYGVKDYLLKPVNASDLRKAMSRLRIQLDAEQKSFEADLGNFPWVAQEEVVSLAKEYLLHHFAESVSLNDLAAKLHLNQAYLARLFRRLEGVAPVRYLRDLRMAHARKLLIEHPGIEIKQVGVLCGYPDQGYFSRVFRQSTGASPQDYRERQRD